MLNEKLERIDISDLSSGSYFYSVSGESQNSVGKIIVRR
jgi:hypothetical protein